MEDNPGIAAELKAESIGGFAWIIEMDVRISFKIHKGDTSAVKAELRSRDYLGFSPDLKEAIKEAVNNKYLEYINDKEQMNTFRVGASSEINSGYASLAEILNPVLGDLVKRSIQ